VRSRLRGVRELCAQARVCRYALTRVRCSAAVAAAGWTQDAASGWLTVAPPPPARGDAAGAVDLQKLVEFAAHMG
jgi:hypothetical protein